MTEWWRGGIIYQIYPRSFMDNNGDGIGDLTGIIQKLDYVASLGIDAVWLSPFFKSPMKDFGYDVEDYRMVDPMFGTLDDFQQLLNEAHKRNLKVVIDQVWAHTSDAHAWFTESRQSKTNAKADWFIWADAKPDGTPPNNWMSIFGGAAWTWDTRREQYYLHHYLTSQPKLNLRNPEVKKAIFDVARFWLEMGVDGFRLDTAHNFLHDPSLIDNPPRPSGVALPNDVPSTNPISRQMRQNCTTHPDIIPFIEEIRALVNEYPDRMLLAEVGGEDNDRVAASYVQTGKRMHQAYTFGLMQKRFDKTLSEQVIHAVEDNIKDGWICWATGNHDNIRVVSRWPYEGVTSEEFARFALAFGLSLRGSFCMYQGEELGLPEAEVPFDLMQDPYGITFYPEFKGRDGCRTPIPWLKDAPHGGFSDTQTKTWLPIPQPHLERAVDVQEKDVNSTLNFARSMLNWRKQQPALKWGEIALIDAPDNVIAFIRETPEQKIICYFNAQNDTVTLTVPEGVQDPFDASGTRLNGTQLTLLPYSFAFLV